LKLKLGIFDSGIGGFTILKSLLEHRCDVQVFYLADNKRNPYGGKKDEEIKEIAYEISNWFKDKDLDALLIACNTTNACALNILQKNLKIPCFDLINSVSENITVDKVGILATTATIRSLTYKYCIEANNKNITVFQQACPEFVSEIEKVPVNLERINSLSEIYLKPLLNEKIQAIILGCSHYPLIYKTLRRKIPEEIIIIDPANALINKFNNSFVQSQLNSHKDFCFKDIEFFATAEIDQFSLKVTNWLGINKKISLVNLQTDA
tara:strand:- start:608 stop:1402 length:795 start_codon:yes stop_codon:yes gene_type:complete